VALIQQKRGRPFGIPLKKVKNLNNNEIINKQGKDKKFFLKEESPFIKINLIAK